MSIDDSLHRITEWLIIYAPRILRESLNEGAAETQLAALETAVGRALPEDFRALYHRFDGMDEDADNLGNFCYGLSFLPLAQVQAALPQTPTAAAGATPLKQTDAAVRSDNLRNPRWLPLGFDGAHTWLRLDLDPAPAGSYGQVIFVDEEYETAFRVADSVAALLADFARDLEAGLYCLNPDAADDGHEFLEADARIDLVNWQSAARWQVALNSSSASDEPSA